MTKGRVEAFSDGVIAIIITIMVLELKVPHETTLDALLPLVPIFGSYVLSFVFIGIYWSNHHHMLHAVKHVNGAVLWANLHLLFWLSLIPFGTAWMDEAHLESVPVAAYAVILLMCGVAYFILARVLVGLEGKDSTLGRAIGSDRKGAISALIYLVSVPIAFLYPPASIGLFVVVAAIWLVPDRRVERVLMAHADTGE